MKTKTQLDCTQGCGFRTKSQEMLKRHLSQKHNVGKGTPGRKALGDKKKKRSEINYDYHAGAKKAKEKKKAIIRRCLVSLRQRCLRMIFPRWQDNSRIMCAPPETVLMKLDGLPVPNRSKLVKTGFHSGDDIPSSAYTVEQSHKIALLKHYREDALSASCSERSEYSDWPSDAYN